MKRLLVLPLLLVALACHAGDGPYNEAADARQDIKLALAQATQSGKSVIVVFGANWCGDCKVLDLAMKQGASAPLVAREFTVVKVDVGRFDRNVAIAESYGVPLKNGIPAVVILSPANKMPLRDARRGTGRRAQHGRERHLRIPAQGDAGRDEFMTRQPMPWAAPAARR